MPKAKQQWSMSEQKLQSSLPRIASNSFDGGTNSSHFGCKAHVGLNSTLSQYSFKLGQSASNIGSAKPMRAVGCTAQTGVDMESLTAVAIAALNVYDSCKAASHESQLLKKTGGKSDYNSSACNKSTT